MRQSVCVPQQMQAENGETQSVGGGFGDRRQPELAVRLGTAFNERAITLPGYRIEGYEIQGAEVGIRRIGGRAS